MASLLQFLYDVNVSREMNQSTSRLTMMLSVIVCLVMSCESEPKTYGSHERLSSPPDRVLVVGNQPSAVSAAITWLQSRGLSTVGSPMPWDIPATDDMIAEQAKNLDAQVIVWIQQTGDLRAPMIAVRGIDVASQAVLWSGHARETEYRAAPLPHLVALLTCRALDAAWGERATDYRRPGFEGNRCE